MRPESVRSILSEGASEGIVEGTLGIGVLPAPLACVAAVLGTAVAIDLGPSGVGLA